MLENRPLGDLKFNGHTYIFALGVNQICPGTGAMANHIV
jgi:hypothetical protein